MTLNLSDFESLLFEQLKSSRVGSESRGERRILAVGSPRVWDRENKGLHSVGPLLFVAFSDVTRDLIERIQPEMVVSPALAIDFDCIDLAMALSAIGYAGAYRATARDLPRPEIIQAEIKNLCPSLDFGFLTG